MSVQAFGQCLFEDFHSPRYSKTSKSCSYILLMFGICVKTGTVKHPSCVWTEQTISSDSDHRPSAELSRGPDGLGLCSSLASLPTSSLHACQMWREGRIHQNLFNQEDKKMWKWNQILFNLPVLLEMLWMPSLFNNISIQKMGRVSQRHFRVRIIQLTLLQK